MSAKQWFRLILKQIQPIHMGKSRSDKRNQNFFQSRSWANQQKLEHRVTDS